MGFGRIAAAGSFQSPAAWQEAERPGSAELLYRRGMLVTAVAQGKGKYPFNPRMHKNTSRKTEGGSR